MPNRIRTEILRIFDDEIEIRRSTAGENVRLQLKNLDDEVRFLFTFEIEEKKRSED